MENRVIVKGMLHIIANIKPIKDFSENVYEFESAIFQAMEVLQK